MSEVAEMSRTSEAQVGTQADQFQQERNKKIDSKLKKYGKLWRNGMLIGIPGIAGAIAFSPALLASTPLFLLGLGAVAVGGAMQTIAGYGIGLNVFKKMRNK